MAPNRKFKTYSKGRNTSVSSAQAIDILFASNLTKRKLHDAAGKKYKNKNKFEVKELKTRIKTLLLDESSFHVNVNDTFDTVFKLQGKKNGPSSSIKSVEASSTLMRSQSSNYVSVASPMVKKLRSFSKQSSNQSSNLLRSWFEKSTPPGVGITNSLEIETASENNWFKSIKTPPRRMLRSNSSNNTNVSLLGPHGDQTISSIEFSKKKSLLNFGRASPIMLRSKSKNISQENEANKNNSLVPTNQLFTNSVTERIVLHSSTPVVTSKTKKRLLGQPVSPINQDQMSECIKESLEEIKSWNTSLATTSKASPHCKSIVDAFESTRPVATSYDCVFEQFFLRSIQQYSHTTTYEDNFTLNESSILCTSPAQNQRRQTNNFITYRRRRKTTTTSLPPKIKNNKKLVIVLKDYVEKHTKVKEKQLYIRLTKLSLPDSDKPKTSLRNSEHHLNNQSQEISMVNHTHTELSVFVDGSRSISKTSSSQSSHIYINTKESSVLHTRNESLGFEDVSGLSEKENEPSCSRSSRTQKRKSLLDSTLLDSSLQKKRYLRSSMTENSNRPSTSTAVNNLSEDLFTSGDFTNQSAHYHLSVFRENKTEISSISTGNSRKSISKEITTTTFSYTDPTEQSHITQYCEDMDELLEFSQESSDLISDTSYIPKNDIIVIDDSHNNDSSDTFKLPLAGPLASITINRQQLKTGKSWRRSTRGSFIDTTNCQSIRIVPSDDAKSRQRRPTILQNYIRSSASPRTVVTAKDIVFKYCNQYKPVPFEMLYTKARLQGSKKIGEGVYGEVFLCPKEKGKMTVMKIIPIEGDKIINGERQKMFNEIISEVVIVSQLSNLRNTAYNKTSAFCEVQNISCVRGKYHDTLLDLWHAYDEAKGSENDPPDIFEDDQLYIVLELGNAGQDLEAYVFQNAAQSLSMFKQIAFALAVAEEQLQFEHRDLHWGNVLLKTIEKDKKVTFKLKGNVKSFASEGVEATIIDFTLSRVVHDGVIIFNDLSNDPDLFIATGDYQFDIYRLMKQKNKNDWKSFTPYSNILWLHYILKKSITALRYKKPTTKVHAKNIKLLEKYEGIILNFDSATEFVTENL